MRLMERLCFYGFLASAVWSKGLQAIHWNGPLYDGDVIYACEGANVTMPWRYHLSSGDVISDIEWFYSGHSEEVIGVHVHGTFLVYPTFSHRVSELGNAGIILHDVIPWDSGNYTVTIVGANASGHHINIQRSIVVQVIDQATTDLLESGHLPVSVSPEVVMDSRTGQWGIQLLCAINVTSLGKPPYTVQWTTPDGQVRDSSSHWDRGTSGTSFFSLLLTSPVGGGNYTCRMAPGQHLFHSCSLRSGGGGGGEQQQQQLRQLSAEASVYVDALDARLTLLEKNSRQAAGEVLNLTQEVQQLGEKTQGLSKQNQRLLAENDQLQHRLNETDGRLEKLTEDANKRVSFHARYLENTSPPAGSPLVVSWVLDNHGMAYDNSTGNFITPYAGTYFFIGKTTSLVAHNQPADIALYVGQSVIDTGDSDHVSFYHANKSPAVVYGTVHLNQGQRVWIRSGGQTYSSNDTSFSGFLVSLDRV